MINLRYVALTLNPTRNIAELGAAATGDELGLFTAGLLPAADLNSADWTTMRS